MPRQPLFKRYPNAGYALGPGLIAQRPQASALIAECITTWTEVELQTALLLAQLLHTDPKPASAMYLALTNERARRDVLYAVADLTLSESDIVLFKAIMSMRGSIAKERNDLAHGSFGITGQDKEGVVWISTRDRINSILSFESPFSDDTALKAESVASIDIGSRCYLYSLSDLNTLKLDIVICHQTLCLSVMYFGTDPASRTHGPLFRTISNEPLVQRFLSATANFQEDDV